MISVPAFLGQLIYPLRRWFNKLFRTGVVISKSKDAIMPLKKIYDYQIDGIDGHPINFNIFSGKKILIVNTASECGFTPQYEGLQKLSEQFAGKLVIIGVPSNNFGAQEPGTESEILNFCQRNYGVSFPLTKKVDVAGANMHNLFDFLTKKELNGWNDKEPNWNFCKYLINESGDLIHIFSHKTDPLDNEIISRIS